MSFQEFRASALCSPVSKISPKRAALSIDPGGLIFGQDQDVVGGGFEATEAWAGAMDNLRIYNRALSASEVGLVVAEAH